MPECVKVLDRNGTVVHMNPAGLRMVEADSPDQVIGTCVYPLIKEEHLEAFRAVNQSVFNGGKGGRLEFEIRGFKGTERIFETNVVPLRGGNQDVIGALSVTRDVTSRRQAELRDAFLVRLDDETRALSDAKEITQKAAQLLCEHLRADRCSYAEIDVEKGVIDITGNYAVHLPSITGRYSLASFGEDFVAAMKAGDPYVIRDAARELPKDAFVSYQAIGISAVTAIPLIKEGRLVAGLGVHQAVPRNWRTDEIELVRAVANRCWESIERARVERELRESEEQFRTLADAIPNLAWMAHPNGHIFWYNQRWYDYTGTTPEQMEGWGWQSVHDPAVLPSVLERWTSSISSAEPFEMVFPLKGADGQYRSFLTRVEPWKDSAGKVLRWFGTNTDVTAQEEAEKREKTARETAELSKSGWTTSDCRARSAKANAENYRHRYGSSTCAVRGVLSLPRRRTRGVVCALHPVWGPTGCLCEVSNAEEHSRLRPYVSRRGRGAKRGHYERPALRKKPAVCGNARRTSPGSQLLGGSRNFSHWHCGWRSFFWPL